MVKLELSPSSIPFGVKQWGYFKESYSNPCVFLTLKLELELSPSFQLNSGINSYNNIK